MQPVKSEPLRGTCLGTRPPAPRVPWARVCLPIWGPLHYIVTWSPRVQPPVRFLSTEARVTVWRCWGSVRLWYRFRVRSGGFCCGSEQAPPLGGLWQRWLSCLVAEDARWRQGTEGQSQGVAEARNWAEPRSESSVHMGPRNGGEGR